jgi:hypothetical protein
MMFNGVELLKLQFSRAVDQTFEHFLDAWSLSNSEAASGPIGYPQVNEFASDIPVSISA